MEPAELLLLQIKAAGLPEPDLEFPFAKGIGRFWRFDLSWFPDLAVEYEGGSFQNGAHQRGKHFESDLMKYGLATLMGWRVLRVNSHMVEDGRALCMIKMALREAPPFPPDLQAIAVARCEKCMTKAEKLKRMAKNGSR